MKTQVKYPTLPKQGLRIFINPEKTELRVIFRFQDYLIYDVTKDVTYITKLTLDSDGLIEYVGTTFYVFGDDRFGGCLLAITPSKTTFSIQNILIRTKYGIQSDRKVDVFCEKWLIAMIHEYLCEKLLPGSGYYLE